MEMKIKEKIKELRENEKQAADRINMLRSEIMKTEAALQQIRGAIAISEEYIAPEEKNEIAEAKEKRGK